MADHPPQDQPQPKPPADWNAISAREIELTLGSATELAYELAGDLGVSPGQKPIRDASELESVETALDQELKQLDHMLKRTREQLDDTRWPAQVRTGNASPIPDFMSEFLSDEPVPVFPPPSPRASDDAILEMGAAATPRSGSGPAPSGTALQPGGHPQETVSKPGLIGVGTLGRRESRKAPQSEKYKPQGPTKPSRPSGWSRLLEGSLYLVCDRTIRLLEVLDRPFAGLAPTTRRAVSVTAIAAFSVCLAIFVLSLLMS